ncbi:hypothetical protein [Sciscionella sediminilitoris]|uniref:hypothetical protein n=1 Tax=Sciscionella sediminilitoris TaxID=1445613 RepID=UPI0004DF64E1|nr:hypothetical protein [Sciscionella sp. SE31]
MGDHRSSARSWLRFSAAVLAVGVLLVVLYYAFAIGGVGKFGTPTDIGGGIMALFGYCVAGLGLIGVLASLIGMKAGSSGRSR